MSGDFQHILEENRCLKKELQLLRHQNDKLQQEISQMKFDNQELLNKNTHLNHLYNQIQKKNQLQLAQYNKDLATMTSQIEELKTLIEQKQQEMENFQIKIIPNLDQDMLRVKLITEMEGPYQDAIDKKDKEISRLKEKNTEIERKYNITELQLSTKEKQFKRQLEATKSFYQSQNEKLLKELNLLMNKKQIKTYDKQVFKVQRKELQQLRCTISLQQQNQLDLRKQLTNLKVQKEKLLLQICHLNQKKALQMHLSAENTEMRSLKQENRHLQDQLSRKSNQVERLQKKIRNLEKQYKDNEQDLKRELCKSKQEWEHEKALLIEELRKLKDDNHRANDAKERKEEDCQRLSQTLRSTERQLQLKKNQCLKIQQALSDLEKANRQLENVRKKKLSLSKDLPSKDYQQQHSQTHKKQNQQKKSNEDKKDSYLKQLEQSNAKLKEKLEFANKKIIELLKQKAVSKAANNLNEINSSFSRDRAFSNIQIDRSKPTRDILLEYRDTSLTPLVPPTIFTRHARS